MQCLNVDSGEKDESIDSGSGQLKPLPLLVTQY